MVMDYKGVLSEIQRCAEKGEIQNAFLCNPLKAYLGLNFSVISAALRETVLEDLIYESKVHNAPR